MAKKTVYTFRNHLGYDGKKYDAEKALAVLKEIGIDATNDIGETPLIVAAYLERIEVLKTILEQTSDVDYKMEGGITETALLEACSQRRLESIQLLVEAGANIEQQDRYGMTPLSKIFTNTFSDPIPSAVYLVSKGAKLTDKVLEMGMSWNKERFTEFLKTMDSVPENLPVITETSYPEKEEQTDSDLDIEHLHNRVNQKDYFKTAKTIWQKLVPKSGQAHTVQGELLRAIEKLRDEAQRNGNGNFNTNCHVLLIGYLRNYLADDRIFDQETVKQITDDLDKLTKKNRPYMEDDVYDRITDRIVDWYLKNPQQLPHQANPALNC